MSNYDPNRPSESSSQPGQVICPNCQGTNPPGATTCSWCGSALAPAAAVTGQQAPAGFAQAPQPGAMPPQYPAPPQQGAPQPPGYQPPQQTQTYGPAAQPQYQQPAAGYAPPPYQSPATAAPAGRRMGRNILLIVGGVVLLLLALCAILFFVVFNATQPMADAGEKFMTSLRDRNDQQAYDLCTSALQTEFGDVATFTSRVDASRPTKWGFTNRNVSNGTGQLDGTATLTDGRDATVRLVLDNVNNAWKISGVQINPK